MLYRLYLISFSLFIHSVSGGTINSELEEDCKKNPEKKVNVMLDLPSIDSEIPDLFSANNRAERLNVFLRDLTSRSQESVVSAIEEMAPDADVQRYWIVNRIGVREVSCETVNRITDIPMEFAVRLEEMAQLLSTGPAQISTTATAANMPRSQWGVQKINAPAVWNITMGQGIVVANIDTGVRGSHEALVDNYRKDYGWLDGFTNSSTAAPNDGNGHGTHTMGSICGKNGIGVAPEATWIACKGCNSNGCPEAALLTCGQWIFCPYTANANGRDAVRDCSKRPRIVNNSWGSRGSSTWYNGVISKWQSVGIIPIFAIGNEGPSCATSQTPGNQNNVISVGSTTANDDLSNFSSRGPFTTGFLTRIKPEISAPGQNILSAWHTGNSVYATSSGTSMAAPHVAGATALILSRFSTLTYTQVFDSLTQNANRKQLDEQDALNTCSCTGSRCSGVTPNYPNNGYGNGRIDVLASFMALAK